MEPDAMVSIADDYMDHAMEVEEETYHCKACGEVLEEGKAYELAGSRWHINCFRCNTCDTQLGDDANLLLLGDGSLICNNCTYSCTACGSKIEDLAILTGDQAFCASCFRCRNCKRKIDNLRYARTSQGIFCMDCHESVMARRRKKSKAQAQQRMREKEGAASSMITEKSLPALPPNAIPRGAFSNDRVDPDSDTPTELSPRPRQQAQQGMGGMGGDKPNPPTTAKTEPLPPSSSSRSSSRPARSPERDDDASPATAINTPRDPNLTLPATSYRKNRNSTMYQPADPNGSLGGGDGESFYIPVALDPTPPAVSTPKSSENTASASAAGSDVSKKAMDVDYFGLNKSNSSTTAAAAVPSPPPATFAAAATTDKNPDSQASTPHIAFQTQGRQSSSDYDTPQVAKPPSRKLSKTSRHESRQHDPLRSNPPEDRPPRIGNNRMSEDFKLQEAPKSKKVGGAYRESEGFVGARSSMGPPRRETRDDDGEKPTARISQDSGRKYDEDGAAVAAAAAAAAAGAGANVSPGTVSGAGLNGSRTETGMMVPSAKAIPRNEVPPGNSRNALDASYTLRHVSANQAPTVPSGKLAPPPGPAARLATSDDAAVAAAAAVSVHRPPVDPKVSDTYMQPRTPPAPPSQPVQQASQPQQAQAQQSQHQHQHPHHQQHHQQHPHPHPHPHSYPLHPPHQQQHHQATNTAASSQASRKDSASSSDHTSPKLSPKLRWSGGGDFSMEEDLARILGTDEGSSSILRRVSNAVRHGRTSSTESSQTPTQAARAGGHARSVSETTRGTSSPRWPKTPIAEDPVNGHPRELSSPISVPPGGGGGNGDDHAFLKRQLRTSEKRVAELEYKLNTDNDLKNLNRKLVEKRKTVSVLDTQTEIMIRQLEVLTGYVQRAKETGTPIDPLELEDSAIREFVQKLEQVKAAMSTGIEQLHEERDALIEDKDRIAAERDRALMEFEQLSNKNAQLADLNNDLTHQIQERFKAQASAAGGGAGAGADVKAPNGLGIYGHGKTGSNANLDLAGLAAAAGGGTLPIGDHEEPIVESGPTVVQVRRGQVKKFNWKKGSKAVAQNVAKGVNRAVVAFQQERERPPQQLQQQQQLMQQQYGGLTGDNIGLPYNMTSTTVESPSTHLPMHPAVGGPGSGSASGSASGSLHGPLLPGPLPVYGAGYGPGGVGGAGSGSGFGRGHADQGRQGFGFFNRKGTIPKSVSTTNVAAPVVAAEPPTTLFGSELAERAEHERRQIPCVVTRCIEEVELRGMDVEGIYRKTGGNSQVKMIQDGFGQNDDFDISDTDIDITSVTSVLKQYFRKLPTPLLTYDVYERILESNAIPNEQERCTHLKRTFSTMPQSHRDCLEFLMFHLGRVAQRESENLMSPKNLAVVFAPTIMRDHSLEREMTDMHAKNIAVQFIVENIPNIFTD